MSPIRTITGAACVLFASACAEPDVPAEAATRLWALSAEPLLQIGVFEGDPAYELFRASSSVRLSDGRIAVANAGTHEIRFYDSTGRHLQTVGGQGGGPEEFRWLGRIFPHNGDSILAFDRGGNRLSAYDADGAYGGTVSPEPAEGTDVPWGAWLYRRFWIDVAPTDSARQAIRTALSAVHVPDTAPSYRYVRPDGLGNVWVREPLAPNATHWHWTVVNRDGRPVATVRTPRRFQIHHVGPDFVLGRWWDEADVNYILLYRLDETNRSAEIPAWLVAGKPDTAAGPAGAEESLRETRGALRRVAVAQEMFFAEHRRYSDDRHALSWDPPEGISLDIIAAEPTGWVAVAAHRDLERICGMSVGTATVPGWIEGSVHCS